MALGERHQRHQQEEVICYLHHLPMAQEASSSNTCPPASSGYSYHVFLSFRGKDTRKTFTDHLYTAFVNAGFQTFRDDDELERGKGIKPELEKAIQQSQSCVIVFSKDYAFSEWCLDELVMILERKKRSSSQEHVVLPIFYDVDPSQVRRQTGSLAEAFATHQKNQSLNRFIKKVVKVIEERLSRTPISVARHLIGIHSQVKKINLWLRDGSTDVGILMIYGMRGIGKTTIAKYVYNSDFKRFEGSSFLENIREVSEQSNGLVKIQRQLLSDILHGRKVNIHSVSEGIIKIQDTISSKRVLLVLDDVDHLDQLDAILRIKIIVTTCCAGLLQAHHKVIKVHNVATLGYTESLELFSWHAFGQDHPIVGYMAHSHRVVSQSGGLPLALKVLGSSLSGKSIAVWESALNKLEAIPNDEILKKIRISFDSLQDDHDRSLFLHIACFFIGMDTYVISRILDDCGFYTTVAIQNLIDRCLVTTDENNKVEMHNMIRDMGRGIVRLESEDPGKRSRLWNHKDSFKVLTENTGTKTIEGLALNMYTHPEVDIPSRSSNELFGLETNAFARMHKLRLLQLGPVQLNGCYKEFPKGLRWLCWLEFPLDSLPCNFPLERLVVLEICYGSLRQVWKGTKYLPSLKILNLSHSNALIETPDFSHIPNLERLLLKDCESLVDVHESIGNLERLIYWNMEDCKNIRKLPKNMCMLKALETLIISGCSNLNELPMEMRKMDSLKMFQADRVPIHRLLTTNEVNLWPRKTPEICWVSYLPRTIVDLSLSDCNLSDGDFPRDFGQLSSLRRLDLSWNPISGLPECIRGVSRLDQLSFYSCWRLKSLVRLPRVVKRLILSCCSSLEKVSFQSIYLPESIRISGNRSLVEVEYGYKLELLEKVDAEMINLLGLSNLESTKTIMMATIYDANAHGTEEKCVPGLYQYGIFSTFLPGNEVPGQFSHKTAGSSISFTLPLLPNLMIRGLNIFAVYSESNNDSPNKINVNYRIFPYPIITEVSNKSKGVKWIYGPTFFGVPGDGQDAIWLSHWKFGNQLESGNEVKECGVQLVYEQEQEQEENMMNSQHNNNNKTDTFYPHVIGGDLSSFEVRPGTYFLCRLPIGLTSTIIDMDVRASVLSNYLIRGSLQITDKEEEQQSDYTLAAQGSSNSNNRGGRGWKVLNLIIAAVFFLSVPLVARSSLLRPKKRHSTRSP
ncbi:Disease resistance protein TIR-NBS-LRR class family [Prunus dulcis]|uniref:Disease resistance protein TIR-NBS-LRR class family n=1 Tax=Prunus dulcis TaxID=3755 RepID=A0A4Y1S1N1_PRUDU|nr:Disease resistance protein TIR-NBS-LRR class family [Prunus dulcis]